MTFWKPVNLNQIVGNDEALELLRRILAAKGKAPRAYMFDGPNGCGKTTIAKLFLASLLPEENTITIGPERFGQILKQEDFSEYKCLIWDHADKLTKDQSEEIAALMDRSRSDQVFAFVATGRIEQCLRSRALRITCSKLSVKELTGLLSSVCAAQGVQFDLEALDFLARKVDGVPSQALIMLQAASISGRLNLESMSGITSDLDDQCRKLLLHIANQQDPMELATHIKNRYEFIDIVDTLFSIYSQAFINKDSELIEKLSNYRKIGEMFIKWKSTVLMPSSALYLLVRELMDSNRVEVPSIAIPLSESKPMIQRSRELTYSEMVDLISQGGASGDIKIR
ncbi:MAG: hypothetical protein WCQ50_19635 [Spirochaetota bacterium]